jgi:hypothetical protein
VENRLIQKIHLCPPFPKGEFVNRDSGDPGQTGKGKAGMAVLKISHNFSRFLDVNNSSHKRNEYL